MLLNTLLTAIVVGVASATGPGFLKLDFAVDRTNATRFKRSTPQGNIVSSNLYYYVDVFVGSSKQRNSLSLDTGSSDTWVYDAALASKSDGLGWYNTSQSTTYKDLKKFFGKAYGLHGEGQRVFGHWVEDTVALSPDGSAITLRFGDATSFNSVGGGVLGVGPVNQESIDTSSGDHNYPNFPEALKQQGVIKKNAFSIYLTSGHDAGTVLFGAIDHAKYSGELKSLPLVDDSAYHVHVNSFDFEGANHDLNVDVFIDSGTAAMLVPQNAFDVIVKKVFPNGHKTNFQGYSYIEGPCPQADDVKFNFNGISIAVPSTNYLQANISGPNTCTLLFIAADGYILGDPFFKNAYTVFSSDDQTISFAPVKHTTESDIRPIV